MREVKIYELMSRLCDKFGYNAKFYEARNYAIDDMICFYRNCIYELTDERKYKLCYDTEYYQEKQTVETWYDISLLGDWIKRSLWGLTEDFNDLRSIERNKKDILKARGITLFERG